MIINGNGCLFLVRFLWGGRNYFFIDVVDEMREEVDMWNRMCEYDEAFTQAEMLEETGFCKNCKLDCPNKGKEVAE